MPYSICLLQNDTNYKVTFKNIKEQILHQFRFTNILNIVKAFSKCQNVLVYFKIYFFKYSFTI